jgi:restriction endonuclease Mrr
MVSNKEIKKKLKSLRRNDVSSDVYLDSSYYDLYRCPKCHTKNEITNDFCKKCGIHLIEPSAYSNIPERRLKIIKINIIRDTDCFKRIKKYASFHRNKSYPVNGLSNLENCLKSYGIRIDRRDLINILNHEVDSLPKLTSATKMRDLDQLEGFQFEFFLNLLFKKMGYHVEQTPLSGDQGADLIINKLNKTVVQAKRYDGNVGNTAVQEVVASIAHYGADDGMVVTTSYFTDSAIELANSNNIKLIDRNELEQLILIYPINKHELFQ